MGKVKNALKESTARKTVTKTKTNKSKTKSSASNRWSSLMADDRTRKIAGGVLLAFAFFALMSCLSYLIHWKHDQALLQAGVENTLREDPIRNLFGRLGARTSHWLMYEGFGWAVLIIPALLTLLGGRLLFPKMSLPLFKISRIALVGMIWLSLALGFFSTQYLEAADGELYAQCESCPGGTQGLYMTSVLKSAVGSLGIVALLILTAGVFVVVQFNPTLSLAKFKSWLPSKESADEADNQEEDLSSGNKVVATSAQGNGTVVTPDEVKPFENNEKNAADEALDELMGDLEITRSEPEAQTLNPDSEVKADDSATEDLEFDTVVKPEPEPPMEGELDIEIEQVVAETELSQDEMKDLTKEFGEYDPKLDLSRYELPTIDLLAHHGDGKVQINKEELEVNKNNIVRTLNNYNIEISKIKATVGPTVTLYEIVPAPGVRISKIKNLEDDIALSLAALGIRIIAPIPGRGTIGIEVPNSSPDIVSMRSLIAADKFQHSEMALPVALGKTISNETFIADLAKMPHLLMAGATGQGKSVGLNAILVSLLYKKHPSQIKFVLVDPKKVELTLFNKIERHFLAKLPDEEEAIITDTSKVVKTLNSLCIEMDDRYELLKKAQCRNLKEYNAKFIKRKLNPENGHKYMPYIVLVVDEFADLIMTAGKEVETPIARLAQLARAIGIHLIIATQRPSVNIITGTIKANFPARIAFRVTSKIDSRTILDAGGADQLIGRGDMLFSTGSDIIRLQCGFVDTPEVDAICDYIGSQQGYPDAFLLPEFIDDNANAGGNIDIEDRDALFRDAASLIVMHQQGSASLLQRKLKLGYNRAGRLIDQLEVAGIIGPFEGSKARKVLIPDEMSLEQLLSNE